MKSFYSLFFLFTLSMLPHLQAKDTVRIKQAQLPIMLERHDNVLLQVRIDAKDKTTFDHLTLQLGKEVDLSNIKSIKLYYAGTESVQRSKEIHYEPVEYISRSDPGKTLGANTSYSILKSQVQLPKRELRLEGKQELFTGINYFWVSVEMQATTPIHTKLEAWVKDLSINQQQATLVQDPAPVRRMGVGVRHAGDSGAEAYRIPGLVTSKQGTLLGVYDVRYNNSVDLQEHVDVGLSRSTDGGQTWEDMRIVLAFGENGGLPKAQNGVGDPAILMDQQTGTIWVVAAWTHGMGNGRAWFNSQQGMSLDKTAQLMLAKSDDDGRTWSSPINITSQLKDPSWYFLLQGPGSGISMADGTLVFASQFIDSTKVPNAGIMYSKDHGLTWHMHSYACTNTTEAQVVELDPGILMLNMRDNRGGSRAVSTTSDMGKTWTEHPSSRKALQESVCMASIIKVAAKDNVLGKDILLFSNPNTTKGRHSITIKMSMDKGMTWPYELLLDEGQGWGYSCLSMIDKETVGILYEGSTAHMVFQAVKLKDIVKR